MTSRRSSSALDVGLDRWLMLDEDVRAAPDVAAVREPAADLEFFRSRRAARPLPAEPSTVHGVERTALHVSGDPAVALHLHRPVTQDGLMSAMLWIHGGGYVMGSPADNAAQLDRWAGRFRCIVASVDYRLAPEAAYPAALEDCHAALTLLHRSAKDLHLDPGRIGVGGSSAGGGLAAALALWNRDHSALPLTFQLLLYPMLDHQLVTESVHWPQLAVWSAESSRIGWRAYLGDLMDGAVPIYASAATAQDLTGLPDACVLTGALDGFVDEDIEYARRLMHAGVRTDLQVYAGAPHGVLQLAAQSRVSRRLLADMEAWLEPRLSPAPKPDGRPQSEVDDPEINFGRSHRR